MLSEQLLKSDSETAVQVGVGDFERAWLNEEIFRRLPVGEMINSEGAWLVFDTPAGLRTLFVPHPRAALWWEQLKQRILPLD